MTWKVGGEGDVGKGDINRYIGLYRYFLGLGFPGVTGHVGICQEIWAKTDNQIDSKRNELETTLGLKVQQCGERKGKQKLQAPGII